MKETLIFQQKEMPEKLLILGTNIIPLMLHLYH